jgi:hypothetical protein
MEWKKYTENILYRDSDCLYQKKVYKDYYANIIQWTFNGKQSYELHIQIPDEFSALGMTLNITCFSYKKLDFKKIEKDAIKVIKKLIKIS